MTTRVRDGMDTIIDRVRRLVNDPPDPGAAATFTDDEIQDALDLHRQEWRYVQLRQEPTLTAVTGATTYLDFYADAGPWEETPTLYQYEYTEITPATSDLYNGHWTFATEPTYPVYIKGWLHNTKAAAAEILEEWAGRLSQQYDFSTADQSFKRSQMSKSMLEMAQKYRDEAGSSIGQTKVIRTDQNV